MSHRAMLALFAVLLLSLAGCAVPRTVGMYGLTQDTAAVPPGGKRLKLDSDGAVLWGEDPGAYTLLNVPKRPVDMLAFYRRHLQVRGWVEKEPGLPAPNAARAEHMVQWYTFDRSSKVLGLTYARERLRMTLDINDVPQRPKDMMKADFQVSGTYAWDLPSKAPSQFLASAMGEYAQLFGLFLVPL